MPASADTPSSGSYLMPTLEHATVADAMHPGVLSCEPDATATEVARMMSQHHVHCLAVMGTDPQGSGEQRVWGIVSDLDLLEGGTRPGAEATAAAMVRRELVNVEPSTPLRDALHLMLTHRAAHLLVVDPKSKQPIGVLSTLDIAGVMAWGES
ncbi:MAG: cyclic nucleotide-binding/CBS domain-containing protein [Solirubrobacteraceae bacterium]